MREGWEGRCCYESWKRVGSLFERHNVCESKSRNKTTSGEREERGRETRVDDETREISGSRLVVAVVLAPGILFFALKKLFPGFRSARRIRMKKKKNNRQKKWYFDSLHKTRARFYDSKCNFSIRDFKFRVHDVPSFVFMIVKWYFFFFESQPKSWNINSE